MKKILKIAVLFIVIAFSACEDGKIVTDIYISTIEDYDSVQAEENSVQSEKIKIIIPEEDTEPETEEEIYSYYEEEPVGSGVTVYITPYGEKYHYSSSCAGKNAMSIDLDSVEGHYDACKKCTY